MNREDPGYPVLRDTMALHALLSSAIFESDMKQNREQKLLLQVSAVVIALFFGAVLFVVVSDYYITRRAFLTSKNEMIDRDLFDMYEVSYHFPHMNWLIGMLEAHPEYKVLEPSPDLEAALEEVSDSYQYLHAYFDLQTLNPEKESPAVQTIITFDALSMMSDGLRISNGHYERACLIDILNEDESNLILDLHNGEYEEQRTGVIPYPASQHSVVSEVLKGRATDSNQTLQEVYRDPETGKDYYIDYLPLVDEGKTAALLCLWYDWSDFNRQLLRHSLNSMLIGILVLLILNGLLVFFLYRQAILPLSKVKDAVVGYMVNKDSQEVERRMRAVTVRNEIGLLADNFSGLTKEIDRNTNEIVRLNEEKTRIEAELNVAATIQEDMLPRIFPPFPDRKEFEIYATMDPAREVGGDFYDFFLTDENHLGLVMADVSGKGVPASLFMVIAKSLIKNRAMLGGTPEEILYDVNMQLCEGNEANYFVTVWFAILDLSTGKGLAANAGHEHPLLRRSEDAYKLVRYPHSPALGIMEGIPFKDHPFELRPGDSLFVYTDGVPEAADNDRTLYGTDRLLEVLNRDPKAEPKVQLENVRQSIDAFAGTAPQFDDITMLGITYFGPEASDSDPSQPER